MNLNKIFIIGNLTRDPELRIIPSGTPVVSFGVATNRVWKNQKGEKQEEVEFHNVVSFGKQAEIINQYLNKGSLVLVEGRLKTRNWEAHDGSKRNRTEIVAERVQFGPRPARQMKGEEDKGAPFKEDESISDLPSIDINEEQVSSEDLPF